jgi:threonine synthase
MLYTSTRDSQLRIPLGQAVVRGIAPDGGLFVPEPFPQFLPHQFESDWGLPEMALHLLQPFVGEDALAAQLPAICREAFNFPAPVVELEHAPGPASALELWHGPTCAFKDFGARFLAACMQRLHGGQSRKLTVLVATSGDTGGAVAAAFHGQPWADVVVLYPKGLVSERQAQQLSCWGGNVRTFCVRGTFDDCQRMVK